MPKAFYLDVVIKRNIMSLLAVLVANRSHRMLWFSTNDVA